MQIHEYTERIKSQNENETLPICLIIVFYLLFLFIVVPAICFAVPLVLNVLCAPSFLFFLFSNQSVS